MSTESIRELTTQHVMNTYKRFPVALVRGQGCRVWDAEGNEYLDFLAGLAVNAVGHCHPRVVEAVQQQAARLFHVSNLYYIEPQAQLARLLTEISPMEKVFFCNSGAEANEAAIKLARLWGNKRGRFRILTAHRSFHGRTLATITATGQPKYQKGFEPLPSGFDYVPLGDLKALEEAAGSDTCAVMLEVIQGEGGVHVADREYIQGVRRLCDERGMLLIIDEVQTGLGRTGKWFAFEHYEIVPDVVTLAKALGGGVPIGATLARGEAVEVLQPGTHASTFGGNPLACAAALATLQTLQSEGLIEKAATTGAYFCNQLERLARIYPGIREVRGKGLMLGVECEFEIAPLLEYFRKRGVLVGMAGPTVLRFLPPLIIEKTHVDRVVEILADWLAGHSRKTG